MDLHGILTLAALAIVSFVLSFYGAAVGLILGHLRLPLLIYYLQSTTAGMMINLVISGVGALTGSFRHAKEGRISFPLIAVMGIPSVVGAGIGAVFLLKFDALWIHIGLGCFLIVSGVNLCFFKATQGKVAHAFHAFRLLVEASIGLVIGFLSSVTGLMLGSLRLPMMMRFLKLDPGIAVGTNMAIGCLTALAGAVCLSPQSGSFPLLPFLIVAPPTILGANLGARYTGSFRKESLQMLVGCTVAFVGLGMAADGIYKCMP